MQFNLYTLYRKCLVAIIVMTIFAISPSQALAVEPVGNKKVVGIVTDSITGERLSFVNVYSKLNKRGTTTDLDGVFTLMLPIGSRIDVTMMGYNPNSKFFNTVGDTLYFYMSPASVELNEVVVKPKKPKYSKKNNPAVELMRRVRKDAKLHDPTKADYYSYDRYDKIMYGLNNYTGYLPDSMGNIKGKFKTLAEFVDTAIWTGKRILVLSMKEKFATRITTGEGVDKEVVLAQRSNGIDRDLDKNNFTRDFIEDALREVNLYSNDINLMHTRFVSPLSAIGADFYMYHIEDTVMIGKDRCIELSFAPHSPESTGFNGKLYIPVEDSVKYVRRALMRLPKAANVNYIQNMVLSQNYEKDSLGYVNKTLDDIILEYHIVGSFGELYMSRQSRYDNRSYARRIDLDSYYKRIGSTIEADNSDDKKPEYWQSVRMLPLTNAESKLAVDEPAFKKVPVLYYAMKIVDIFVKGYIPTAKKSPFDIGRVTTFISYNGTEGLRLALGGLTTTNLFKNVFVRGYGAYGFHDNKWKYDVELEYSFNKKKYQSYEYPINSLRATYRYDVNHLGQNYKSYLDNMFYNSIKRTNTPLATYQTLGKLEYNIEWLNHLSLHASFNYTKEEATKHVQFVDGLGNIDPYYTQNYLKVQLRWAPGEKFLQSYDDRRTINLDAFIISLSHTYGPKGFLGSKFTYNLTELYVQKRFWFSAFGAFDIFFRAGKLWNQVQYPALCWQFANLAYTTQPETFCLLNPMEFAMDQFVMLNLQYNLNGLILNRIPLIKKLHLREVVTFKSFIGSLTKKNNPAYNDNLYRFPELANTQPMGKTPYMEVSVGLDNILTLIRLDYVWRISYTDRPNIAKGGLRFSFRFDF